MRKTQPEIFLIGRPSLDWDAINRYLHRVHGGAWAERQRSQQVREAESLVEFAGRLCYRSWDVGLNPNITRIRKESSEYFSNILSSKHGSVLEHAQFSFVFHQVSRVFTHELVRHRAGIAVSQESLRYVRLTELGVRIPPALTELEGQIVTIVERLEEFQRSAAQQLKLDEAGVSFHIKKEITSALRRLAPIGLSTEVLWSANIRTLRHVIEMRTAEGAEEEMRLVFGHVGQIMKSECPLLFADFSRNEAGEWVPAHSKV